MEDPKRKKNTFYCRFPILLPLLCLLSACILLCSQIGTGRRPIVRSLPPPETTAEPALPNGESDPSTPNESDPGTLLPAPSDSIESDPIESNSIESNSIESDPKTDPVPDKRSSAPLLSFAPPPVFQTEEPSSSDPIPRRVSADTEMRGVWIASVWNINYPSQPGLSPDELRAELEEIVETVDSVSCNAIYFQVHPCADALYDSTLFPVSSFLVLSNRWVQSDRWSLPGGFDPLLCLIELAHARGIEVHAWVNPLRVSAGTDALSSLDPKSHAFLHPETTVAYGGNRFYNAGLPEVRAFVADGVREIVEKYDVDGVVFDDYFYPYPVEGEEFDDADTFARYGSAYADLADFRRASVNDLVRRCYETVKAVDPSCRFGIAPFGIWQNSDGQNGGSDTWGLSSYSAIYCDTLAWVRGGYVDYVAPQLYWQFTTTGSQFDILDDWWENALAPYPNVDLYITHAAYRCTEWKSDEEIQRQIVYARNGNSYRGSLFYGYQAIRDGECLLPDQLRKAFSVLP